MAAKRFLYKVYNPGGDYVGTWDDVANDLRYKTAIGSGVGEFVVDLPRKIKDFGESSDVAFGNRVDVYCFDEDAVTGVLIASGRITRYTPSLAGRDEGVRVTCLGYVHQLALIPFIEGGLTRFNKATTDPSEMFKDIFDASTAEDGVADYDGSSVDLTGLSETYEFNALTCLEALRKVIALCPSSWYWYIDTDNVAYLKEKASTAAHTFRIGREASEIKADKDIEDLVNRIYFTGGVVFTKYLDQQQSGADADQALGTTTVQKVAQSFIAGKSSISGVSLKKSADTGTPTARLLLSIHSDSDGEPATDALITRDITDDWNAATVDVATPYQIEQTGLIEGELYWFVLSQDANDDSNHYNVRSNSAGGYASGSAVDFDGSVWDAITGDLYFGTYYPANLFKKYDDTVSQGQWGLQAIFKEDERITNEGSMDQIAAAVLESKAYPNVRMVLKITDNNNNAEGYDIESIKPGDTCYIRNLVDADYSKWDLAVWDRSFWDRSLGNIQELLGQIQSVQYAPDFAIIEVSTRPPRIAETIDQLERDIRAAKVDNNPDAPST